MTTRSVRITAQKAIEIPTNALAQLLDVPLVSQFYEPPELAPIVESKTKLKLTSIGIYLLTTLAFALLVYQGLTTVQEVSMTVIVTTGLDDGFVCKSLGKYSGQAYSCYVNDLDRVAYAVCNPPKPAVNCPNGCTTAGVSFYGSFGWDIQMKNVYFESYTDCVSKIGSIVKATIAPSATVTYSQFTKMNWPPYNGPISIGDKSAVLEAIVGSSLRSVNMGSSVYYFVMPSDRSAFCGADGTNYNTDGTVILDSSVDLFIKGLSTTLLRDKISVGPSCPDPTPENICQPFKNIGPYSCTKTTQITQPVLQVLGSSVSNATTVMTVASMALVWIVKQWDQKISSKQNTADKVAPKTEITTEPPS